MTLTEIQELANASTHERRRAEYMGWTFSPVIVQESYDGGLAMLGSFRCVCGALESYRFMTSTFELTAKVDPGMLFDPAAKLRQAGSFSREHLLADGYAPAEVERLVRRGEEFDAAAGGLVVASKAPPQAPWGDTLWCKHCNTWFRVRLGERFTGDVLLECPTCHWQHYRHFALGHAIHCDIALRHDDPKLIRGQRT